MQYIFDFVQIIQIHEDVKSEIKKRHVWLES